MIKFDYDSILNRLIANLQKRFNESNITNTDFLPHSVSRRLLSAIAEELSEQARFNEYLTTESKWQLARNISSLLTQSQFFNYIPHRMTGSKGILRVSRGTKVGLVSIPKWTRFEGNSISFTASETKNLNSNTSSVDINVIQGIPQVRTFEISSIQTSLQHTTRHNFLVLQILENDIENNLIEVRVGTEEWERINYLREAGEGEKKYQVVNKPDFQGIEIHFGDGFFGKKVEVGELVTVRFLKTVGSKGDITAINSITTIDTSTNTQLLGLTVSNPSELIGGLDYEDIESIRVNAPRIFTNNQRAITKLDYEIISKSAVANIEKMSVWGETEINEDLGNPAGTYLPLQENLVYITGYRIDNSGAVPRGLILSPNNITTIRDRLNTVKGITDIIQFINTQFIYIIFNVEAFVVDINFPLEEVRTNISEAISSQYALARSEYRNNLYFSQYYEFINRITGVNHHRTTLSYLTYLPFSSISTRTFNFNINIGDIKLPPTITNATNATVKLYLEYTNSNGATSTDLFAYVLNDGTLQSIQSSGANVYTFESNLFNYRNGNAGEVVITSGINTNINLANTQIRVEFEIDTNISNGDVILTKREQIYAYFDSTIRVARG